MLENLFQFTEVPPNEQMVRRMELYYSIAITCTTLIFGMSITRFQVTEAKGFSIGLIHRDYFSQSPSLISSLPALERVSNALQRSFNRMNTLGQLRSASADIFPDNGEYLMKLSIGTPPVETLAIADTGSDLTWIQCKPCNLCFDQKAPLFEPNRSSTYKPVTCASNPCNALHQGASCHGSSGTCRYMVSYGDGSFTSGNLVVETITLGSGNGQTVTVPNVTIGCGHYDRGTFRDGASGIIGLGGGKASLITQMGSSIRGKFSYCLVPHLSATPKPSQMNFGDNAVVLGNGVVSTPIVAKKPKTFYFLTLEGITVGNQKLDFYGLSDIPYDRSGDGNIIIDSGTTLTFLPRELYYRVEAAVRRQMKLVETNDPRGLLRLCYLCMENAAQVPGITLHFRGADLKLKAVNTFVRTSKFSLCLALAPGNGLAIYGNLAQMDFLVGYDLVKKIVSFKPTDCSKS